MGIRKITTGILMIMALAGCADEPPPAPVDEAIADIRENTTTLTTATDDDLVDLMIMSCDVIRSGGFESFELLFVQYDIDPYDTGVVVGNAVRVYCPEFTSDLEQYTP